MKQLNYYDIGKEEVQNLVWKSLKTVKTITWNVALEKRRLLGTSDQVTVLVVSVGEPMVRHLDSVIYNIA